MEIISFTGKSGTGKSYQANRICIEKNIEAIIDDGLFIYKGKVIAGSSAKKCSTKAAAVRTALFSNEKQAETVRRAIRQCRPKRMMIIGTSDRMVDWITKSLELHSPDERLYIEDFTTEEEREIAFHSRHDEGNHVIPAPMGQLRRDFSGYFMNPLKLIQDLVIDAAKEYNEERDITVVRPHFSYFGKFSISARAIRDIVEISADNYEGISVEKIQQHGRESKLTINVDIKALKTADAVRNAMQFQETVHRAVEDITSFSVNAVNVRIQQLCSSTYELEGGR